MKKIHKCMNLFLVLVMAISVFTYGCGSTQDLKTTRQATEAPATSKTQQTDTVVAKLDPIVLKLYMVGDKAKDTDLVLEELNNRLKEKINASMQLQFISWGDFGTKYPLVFAANEDFDAIFTATWSFYQIQAQKHGFLEITNDLLKKNAPNIYSKTPKEVWDQVKVNGKVYMIPQLQKECSQYHFIIRGDLRKKYNVPEIKSMDDLDAYFDAVLKNEKDIIPLNIMPNEMGLYYPVWQSNEWAFAGNNDNFNFALYNITDPASSKLINSLDTPQYMEMLKRIRRWNEKGYIPKSILTSKVLSTDNMKNGKSAILFHNLGTANSIYLDFKQKHPEWNVEVYDGTMGKKVLPYSAAGGGIGIHAVSKNADRMLMAIDFLRYDKDANFLAQRGIKGKHWDIGGDGTDENVVKPGPNSSDYGGSFTWGPWRNSEYQAFPAPENSIGGYKQLFDSLEARVVNHPLQAFNFNDENVKNELAAINQVFGQYGIPLQLGFSDPEKGLAILREKLKQAGFDRVFAEMQKQADDFMKTAN